MGSSGTGAYEQLLSYGLAPNVAQVLDDLIAEGYFPPSGYPPDVATAFQGIDLKTLNEVIQQYKATEFKFITDFGAHLVRVLRSIMPQKMESSFAVADQRPFPVMPNRGLHPPHESQWERERMPPPRMPPGRMPPPSAVPKNGGQISEKMQSILDRTGYKYEVTSGQRSYGPAPGYENFKPPKNSQCYFGKIPLEWNLEDVIEIFEKVGTIWHIRLMMNPETGRNQTYGFVKFLDPETAKKAVQVCDGWDCYVPGSTRKRKMLVKISEPNRRLFVGPIPKSKSREDIFNAFSAIVEGIEEVIVQEPADPGSTAFNKGFCFLEFTDHSLAAKAKKRLDPGTIPIKDWRHLTGYGATWADPLDEPDEEVMSKVKNVYITKLTENVTESDLSERFAQYGPIERVKKVSNYAFINFAERDHALQAIEGENNKQLKDSTMKVTLAKPVPENMKNRLQQIKEKQSGSGQGGPGGGGPDRGFDRAPMGGGGGQRRGPEPPMGYPSDYGYADDQFGYDQYSYGYGSAPRGGSGYGSYGGTSEVDPYYGYRSDPYAARPPALGSTPPYTSPRGPPPVRAPLGRGMPPAPSGYGMRGIDYGDKRPFGGRGGPPPKRGRPF